MTAGIPSSRVLVFLACCRGMNLRRSQRGDNGVDVCHVDANAAVAPLPAFGLAWLEVLPPDRDVLWVLAEEVDDELLPGRDVMGEPPAMRPLALRVV